MSDNSTLFIHIIQFAKFMCRSGICNIRLPSYIPSFLKWPCRVCNRDSKGGAECQAPCSPIVSHCISQQPCHPLRCCGGGNCTLHWIDCSQTQRAKQLIARTVLTTHMQWFESLVRIELLVCIECIFLLIWVLYHLLQCTVCVWFSLSLLLPCM